MGFLKIFKKKEPKENLDIPPPPPLSTGPGLTGGKKKQEKKELPPLPPLEPIVLKHRKIPEPSRAVKLPVPGQPSAPSESELPQFPSLPDIREMPTGHMEPTKPPMHPLPMQSMRGHGMPHIQKRPRFMAPFKKQAAPGHISNLPQRERIEPFVPPVRKREELLRREIKGPLFVRQDSYKAIIDGVSIIKKKLKESDDLVLNLNGIKDSKDKEFERWRISLEDIQRKLIYVDKILYEK